MPFALYLLALVVFAMGTSEFMLAGLVPVGRPLHSVRSLCESSVSI